MLTPTPMLRPSPLDISGLFAGSFAALKQRFWLFVLIALFPSLIGIVTGLIGVMILVSTGVLAGRGDSAAVAGGLGMGIGVFAVGIFAMLLVQLKSQGMMAAGAYEVAQGAHPDFRGLLSRTRGFLPRMAPVIAIAIGAVVAFYGLVFALVIAAIGSSRTSRGSSGAAVGMIVLIVLLFLLVVPLAFFLQTKLLYTVPAIAIEQVGGIDGMKRSWNLTKGAFWRTLGYYLLAALGVAAITYLVSLVGQFALMPALMDLNRSSSPAEVLASLAAMIPAYLLLFVLQLVVQLVSVPFLQSYVTYMFIDQVRRSELPAYGYGGTPPGYGYYPGPQAPSYPQPGQYYGQPGQGYPQPGQNQQPPAN